MDYVNSWTRDGIAQGLAQGLAQGEQNIVLRMLLFKLGSITPELEAQIRKLAIPQLEKLGIAIFELGSLEELEKWLEANPPSLVPEAETETNV